MRSGAVSISVPSRSNTTVSIAFAYPGGVQEASAAALFGLDNLGQI
jgi:hypothetical protein